MSTSIEKNQKYKRELRGKSSVSILVWRIVVLLFKKGFEKTYAQMQQLDQIMFSDFTHEPAVKLSEELIKILPKGQNKIFFNDNGSTAVEAGIKMALQYYFNQGEKRSAFDSDPRDLCRRPGLEKSKRNRSRCLSRP